MYNLLAEDVGERAMAWYDDPNKTLFVGTYANEKQLQWEVDAATRRGWVMQERDQTQGEAIIGRESGAPTAVRARGQIQVTFARAEDWLANRKLEIATALQTEAARAADAKEARLVKAEAELGNAERQFAATAETAATVADSAREQTERQLLGDLKSVIAKRQAALKALEEAIREMNDAVAVGASEFARSVASHMKAHVAGQARLEAELRLLVAQEQVARAAKEWKEANDRRRATEEELRKRTAEFEAKDDALYTRLESRNAALEEIRQLTR